METYVAFMQQLATTAAATILPHFRTQLSVADKSAGRSAIADFDPVTAADREAEAAMRSMIESRFPAHGIIGEEFGDRKPDADHVWIIDPIDGTRAFICGLPLWGTLIGLRHRGEPVMGMIAQPHIGERFVGYGDKAWMERNDLVTPMRTRECSGIGQAILSATSPTMFVGNNLQRFQQVEKSCRLLRYGYDCYAYAMVAMGLIDCVVEASLKPCDIDPIIPIIESAGGVITDWQGGSATGKDAVVAAGDRRVLDDVLALLNR